MVDFTKHFGTIKTPTIPTWQHWLKQWHAFGAGPGSDLGMMDSLSIGVSAF